MFRILTYFSFKTAYYTYFNLLVNNKSTFLYSYYLLFHFYQEAL